MKHKILTLYWDDTEECGVVKTHDTELNEVAIADAIQDGYGLLEECQTKTIRDFMDANKDTKQK